MITFLKRGEFLHYFITETVGHPWRKWLKAEANPLEFPWKNQNIKRMVNGKIFPVFN
jgi:hypothetical protein